MINSLFINRLQIFMKFSFPIYDRKRIGKPIKFLSLLYEQNEHDDENLAIIANFMKLLTFCSKWLIGAYVYAVLAAFSGPAILYLMDGGREMMIPTSIPGTSVNSSSDYALNIIDQAFICIASGCIYLYFDLLILILVLHVGLMTDILIQKIRMITAAATNHHSPVEIRKNFRNIVNVHNELYE